MMKNYVDAMADALVDVLKYSDSSVEWPDIDDLQYDEAIKPEWFYPALQSEGESELMAILQYTQMAGLYDEEIGDLVLGVGLVEMKHFANVRDVVIKLKGTIPQPLNTKKLELGKNAGEALVISIKNEILTIQFYESVKEKIASQSKSAKTILQMLDKLIADERLHLKLFYQQLVKMKLPQGVESLKSTLTRYLKLD